METKQSWGYILKKKFWSVIAATLALALTMCIGSSATAFEQSKTFNLAGNSTWSFNNDCSRALALWPGDQDPGSKEWRAVRPGERLRFLTAQILVEPTLTCDQISSTNEASGQDADPVGTLFVDDNGDGVFVELPSNAEFLTPALDPRVEPYRITAYWEYAPGLRVVNEYWIYVGNLSSVSINSGDIATSNQEVVLNLTPIPGTNRIQVANDGGFQSLQEFSSRSSLNWRLGEALDAKSSRSVYVRFIDRDGQVLGTLSDDIVLDGTPPSLTQALATKSSGKALVVLSNSKVAKKFSIKLSALDAITSVTEMQISATKDEARASSLDFSKSVVVRALPKKPVFVRVKDAVGNWSNWRAVRLPKS